MEIENLENKYIEVILKMCLNFEQSKSLLIHCSLKEHLYFAEKVKKVAEVMGIKDIKILVQDLYEIHDYLKNTNLDSMDVNSLIDRSELDVYAKKKGSILFLISTIPNLMNDIDAEKIQKMIKIKESTTKYYRKNVAKYVFPWTIVAVPNKVWSEDLFGKKEDSYEKLYNLIFKMCMIDKDDPINEWDKYIKNNNYYKDKLNRLKIKTLHYTNSLGTDLFVGIPKDNIWLNMDELDAYGNKIMPNLPSYEIFTSPDYRYTNGIVYSSKPLYYNDCLIDKFSITFKNGQAVDCDAMVGKEVLKKILFENENADKLGEVALVPYDSPISNTGVVFKTTLFDENAACHIALGAGFDTTFKDYNNCSEEQLKDRGLNVSPIHVDFMIGTSDLKIEAETENGTVLIFKDGNFCI